jgi:hypothetical protein
MRLRVPPRIATARLVAGTVCGWLAAGFAVWWLATTPRFDDRPRTAVSAPLADAQLVPLGEERALDLRLAGRDVRFRVWPALLHEALHDRVPPALAVGAPVTLQVATDELQHPSVAVRDPEPTVGVDAIAVGETGETMVLSLEAARRWNDSNRRIAVYLAPVLVLIAIVVTVGLIDRLRARGAARPLRQ